MAKSRDSRVSSPRSGEAAGQVRVDAARAVLPFVARRHDAHAPSLNRAPRVRAAAPTHPPPATPPNTAPARVARRLTFCSAPLRAPVPTTLHAMAAAILRRLTTLTPAAAAAAASARVAPRPLLPLLARGVSDSTDAITVETSVPFKSHIVDPPSRSATTSARELLSFFRDMALMRRAEIAADSLYKAKLIRGFCHLYDGQEAVAVGMEAAITRADAIITAYRDHCLYLARGGDLVAAFAELMGRRDGCSRGKGGSMHFYKRDANFFGGHGIVGAQVPLGCGIAFAQRYRKEGTVTFDLYGDGAANQGQLFEALNMAALWKLPVILVCENNHYGMGTAEWRASKSPAYYKRGDYVPGLKVDGMDVLAVKQACKFAKDHALENGPIILEMDTYRYHGHSMSDPGSTYRTRDEIAGIRQERDPIERVRKLILAHDFATAQELKDMEKEIRKQVDAAIAKAKESPMPDPSELFTNVYVNDCGLESFGVDRKVVRTVLP